MSLQSQSSRLVGVALPSRSSWVEGGGSLRSTIPFSLKGDIVDAAQCGCRRYRGSCQDENEQYVAPSPYLETHSYALNPEALVCV
ncbi:hypothetical protein Q7C36_012247 [Tachysurus vachellii]|uniref:Uncharacterized protein n=1 Tax=Tachysurus vachellii TaxID=175792 RepID=A0AA88MMA9_TACVA|nr:hypothetical protein Q7C36_012247 [Tachysurus vachellii]